MSAVLDVVDYSNVITKLVDITPAIAREMLKRNKGNRPISKVHVANLQRMMRRGTFMPSPQPIAFDTNHELIQGQHRLLAIAGMEEGYSIKMMVSTGWPRDVTFPVLDTMQVTRSTAQALGVADMQGQIGNMLARVYTQENTAIDPEFARPFVEAFGKQTEALLEFAGHKTRVFSTVSVRAACVVCMRAYDQDYALLVYRSLVMVDAKDMVPIANAMVKAVTAGKLESGERNRLFAVAMRVFNPACKTQTSVRVPDVAEAMREAADLMRKYVRVPVFVNELAGEGKPKRPRRKKKGDAD